MVTEEWLANLNTEFRAAGIEQRQRPWEAIRRYSEQFNTSVNFSSDVAKTIFKWFEANSKPGAHQVGSLYEAVYFYDAQFWVVSIPISYGTVQLNALDCIHEMPNGIKQEMMADHRQSWDYVLYWADCLDYGMGVDDLRKMQGLNEFGLQLLMSADQELRSATSILSQHRPDPRAILNCRMALEIFFKSYVALKNGLTQSEAKAIGHNLNKGLDKFIEASGFDDWESTRQLLSVFPDIHERYKEQDITFRKLWDGYSLAHSLGAVIIREFTDRNTIQQVMASSNAN
ncbi:TPA: hypothetical protein NKX69_000057 [Vibrio parahaemolyticus]|uniref:hypothetical protein n=1 Tax=Vibrio parahaemolyticus TaxID=670 RepID=UPI001E292868|nr:hypothetical protein [Vibrio parahaemolyticus]HCG8892418.1 hypothetical protein [Vibrio parahaemolyticus]HCG9614740.1 hypothetical protein [Vibrio parahaemolyticus]HCG9921664.1 hypothetical protein [Vibrio parahaemolyticus]HCH3109789.1 hypothetical protein [Vibrio parahaemolyticus]HCH3493873.1 hypothetical protein [Vibrio parahaemolyticus]